MIKHYKPDADLAYWIDYIWMIKIEEVPEAQRDDIIMPLAHMNVIFNFGDAYYFSPSDSQTYFKLPDIAVVGMIDQAYKVRYEKNLYQIGVAIKPIAYQNLFSENETKTILEGSGTFRTLYEQLKIEVDDEVRISCIWMFIRNHLTRLSNENTDLYQMMQYIDRHIHTFSVKQMAHDMGMSLSTLERKFKRSFGISPKAYVNIKRFHLSPEDHDYFYDQSHAIKTTKRYTTKTPQELERESNELTLKYLSEHKHLRK